MSCLICGEEPPRCDCTQLAGARRPSPEARCRCGEAFHIFPGEEMSCFACGSHAVADAGGVTVTHGDHWTRGKTR